MFQSQKRGYHHTVVSGSVGLFAVAGRLVGCGKHSKTGATKATSAAPATTATTTTATRSRPSAADERVAFDAQVKATDLRSGWEPQERTQGSESEAKCQGVDRRGPVGARPVLRGAVSTVAALFFLLVLAVGARAAQLKPGAVAGASQKLVPGLQQLATPTLRSASRAV